MKKSYTNNTSLAFEILRGKWLLHESEYLRVAARKFLERQDFTLIKAEKPQAYKASISGDFAEIEDPEAQKAQMVMIIPMHGCLTKYDNCMGCSTLWVADILNSYRDDDDILGFILDIDSPGGASNSVMPLINEIKKVQASGKPIIAHCDQCCSGAYWIASQCDAVFGDNIMSNFGSIGAYCEFRDERDSDEGKLISVYAPESTDKNKSFRDALDGKTELMEKELSEIVQHFIADVKRCRPDIDDNAEGVFTGAVFETAKAVDLGLINGMQDLPGCIENVYVRANK